MTDKIYNIPAGCAFAEVLAGHFLREYHGRELELTDVLFLLPNRRADLAIFEQKTNRPLLTVCNGKIVYRAENQ